METQFSYKKKLLLRIFVNVYLNLWSKCLQWTDTHQNKIRLPVANHRLFICVMAHYADAVNI
jgi:hypothetical protein